MTPREDFDQTLAKETEGGNEVANQKETKSGTVIEFKDGGKLRILSSGHMVYDKADGTKFQRNPDGTGIEVSAHKLMSIARLTSLPHLPAPCSYTYLFLL